MANKRMFSKQITSSDAFVDMPASSQLLYFHLNMEADDDGFVGNPKRVVRMLNVSDDDFKILIAKRFILAFENGVIVIKHWLLHNAVRKDMYQQTQYLDEKNTLMIKDNNVYTEVRNESVTSPLHRLDKIRLDKIIEDKESYGESGLVKMTIEEHQKLIEAITETNTKILIEELDDYLGTMTPKKRENKYASHYKAIRQWARKRYKENQSDKLSVKGKNAF